MKRLLLLAIVLFITACSNDNYRPVVDPIEQPEMVDPGFAATKAQSDLNSANYKLTGTAQRQLGIEATADRWTQEAIEATQSVSKTQYAQTQSALTIKDTEQAMNKTSTAVAGIVQAIATEQYIEMETTEYQEWGITQRSVTQSVVFGFVVVFVFVCAVGIIALNLHNQTLIQYRKERNALEIQQARDKHEMEMLRAKIEAMAAAIRETNAGTYVPMLNGEHLILPSAHPIENTTIVSDAPSAPKIVINNIHGSHEVNALSPEELKAQDEMLEWVDLSIDWHNKQGKQGTRERQLKRYNHIGKDPNWQVKVSGYFGEEITTAGSAGSFARNGDDLGTLRSRLKNGKVHARINSEKQTITADNKVETVNAEVVIDAA